MCLLISILLLNTCIKSDALGTEDIKEWEFLSSGGLTLLEDILKKLYKDQNGEKSQNVSTK